MAWIVPAVLGITSMISQNAQNKAAIANNDNQQAAALANAEKQRAAAKADIAPFMAPGAGPVANRNIQSPGPQFAAPGGSAYGLGGQGGQVNAASVMQGGPQQQPQGQQGQGGMDPRMMAMFSQFLKAIMAHAPGQTPQQTMPIQRAPAPPMAPPQPAPQPQMRTA